jgi:hypothetical protein
MNAMIVTGRYDCIIIPVEKRNEYISTLKKVNFGEDIVGFCTVYSIVD